MIDYKSKEQSCCPDSQVNTSTNGRSALLSRFAHTAAEYADRPACIWDGNTLTYDELDRSSSKLAGEIMELAADSPSPVALFLDRSCEVLIACLAAAKAGVPYVPLSPTWPEERIRKALNKVGARVAIATPTHPAPKPLTDDMTVIEVDARKESGKPSAREQKSFPETDSSTPLYILFTSGSTGEPKGVVVTHGNVFRFSTAPECPGFQANKRVTSCCATVFDVSVTEIWGGMLSGCTMICCPKETFLDSRRCLDFFRENHLNYAVLPTAVFNALASQDPGIFGSLEKLILCGELPNSALCKEVQDTAPPNSFYNAYGPTECTVFVTVEKIGDIDGTSIIPAGLPLPSASISIVDKENNLLPPEQWGEVLIGGEAVAAGYFEDSERTALAFVPNPADPATTVYRTGDRGMVTRDGRLLISGRFDDQVKVSGMRVELGEIKTLINAAPGVRVGHVVHKADHGLIAYAVMEKHPAQPDEKDVGADLRVFLEKHLPAALVPRHIIFVPVLPLNSNGKVDSGQLPLPNFCQSPLTAEDDTSEILEAFRAALLDDEFGPEDSFLASGGNSLVAATLIGTLHRQTGVWVPLEYFSKPKTAQLVQMFICSAKPATTIPSQQSTREQVRF